MLTGFATLIINYHALENMKKNVYNTFCTKIDHQWLTKDSIIDHKERDCFGTLSEFERGFRI
jgi:hypothetical protein